MTAGLEAVRQTQGKILDDINVHKEGQSQGLQNCYDKLEVRNSPIEGFGVFATADISKGVVLEEIPFILWPRYTHLGERVYETLKKGESWMSEKEIGHEDTRKMFDFKTPEKYYFKWNPPNKEDLNYNVIPLGFGPIYNSSNTDNNAGWKVNLKTFSFVATRDIKKGEEVCTFYGYFLSDTGAIFRVPEVFGLGLELNRDNNRIYLRCLRFGSAGEAEAKSKDAGYQTINRLLGKSGQRLSLRAISVVENNEEKHQFTFPHDFSLHHHYMKLHEFRNSRFKNIKLVVSYEDEKQKKTNAEALEYNLKLEKEQGDPEKMKKYEEHGSEVILTNFNGL